MQEVSKLDRGDIVVFEPPRLATDRCGAGGTFAKRVIGLPGETVSLRDGFVYINGKRLDEPYIDPGRRDYDETGQWRVPAGEYFVMGDNRTQSCDSRRWGTVAHFAVDGKVVEIERSSGRIKVDDE